MLIEILANFVDAWVKFRDISISLSTLAIPTLIGLIYFVVAVIVVPRDLSEWTNLDDYMATRRRWIAGFLIVGNLLILALEATRVGGKTEGGTSTSVLRWFIANGWLLGSYALVWWGRPRWLMIVGACLALLFYITFYGIIPVV